MHCSDKEKKIARMRHFCLNCDQLMRVDASICSICFTKNKMLLMASKVLEKLSFTIIDSVPKDFILKSNGSAEFLKRANQASLLILTRWDKTWLGGIVCTRMENTAGLVLSYYSSYTMPRDLRVFLLNLVIDTCAKAQQEELHCPPKLSEQYEQYCSENLAINLQPKFIDARPYKRLLLRDLPLELCDRVTENLEHKFNTESDQEITNFLGQVESSNCKKS